MVARLLLAATPAELDAGFELDGGSLDPSLVAALNKMRTDRVDSDGDGMEDLDELSWHSDPNTYEGLKPDPTPQVNYGCEMTPKAPSNVAIFTIGIGGAAILVLRRLRTRPGKPSRR